MAIGHPNSDQGLSAAEVSEIVLISRAKAGDAEAFAELYLRYRSQVMRLARARLADQRTAEEVVQETFLRALRRIDRVDPARPFGPWLMTIAANLVVDSHRTRDRLVPTEDVVLDRGGGGDATVDAVLAAEGVQNITDALSTLPPRQRRILLSSTLLEMSPAELARRENVSEASVTSVVYRARVSIRRSLRRLAGLLVVFRAIRSRVREETASITSMLSVTGAEAAVSGFVLSIAMIAVAPPTGRFHERAPAPIRDAVRGDDVVTAFPHGLGRPPVVVAPKVADNASPVRTSARTTRPREDGIAPAGGRVRVEVLGPDGSVWHYEETDFACEGSPAVRPPEPIPVRTSC